MNRWWETWFRPRKLSEEEYAEACAKVVAEAPVPCLWMVGKTGSGKTSIVRYLTGATDAEIGNGFRPQTKHSRQFDFPDATDPLLKLVDTRGLAEAGYDHDDDVRAFSEMAHLIVVVVRVMDHAQSTVLSLLERVRRDRPNRPVLLVLTCLHEAYPGAQHPEPDPFAETLIPESVSENLRRCLRTQSERFGHLVDVVVPIDLTVPDEGFTTPEFGGERLKDKLLELLPAAQRQTLSTLEDSLQPFASDRQRRAMPHILGAATLAATAAAIPAPWADIPLVMGIQSHMVYRLAKIYDQPLDSSVVRRLTGALGGQFAIRMAVRAPLKAIPWVGLPVNAAMAFVYTYGLGEACRWYFGEIRHGHMPSDDDLQAVLAEKIKFAREFWQHRATNTEDRPAVDGAPTE